MERLLGWKFWGSILAIYTSVVVWLAGNINALSEKATTLTGLDITYFINESWLPALLGFLIFICFLKPVWRRFWRMPLLGKWLSSSVFPDLNGEWDVTLRSNWPVIDKMRLAAKGTDGPRFNPDDNRAELSEIKLRARINQSWFGVQMEMHRPDAQGPMDMSRTISFDLIPETGGHPPAIAYVYDQANRPEDIDPTDLTDFLGAARLEVRDDDGTLTLKGHYFTGRNWTKGYNTAGTIEMVRVKR